VPTPNAVDPLSIKEVIWMIEVRALQVKDVFRLAAMFGKMTRGVRSQMALALSGAGGGDATEVGLMMFQALFSEAEDDLKEWMADMIGKNKEEFEVMPPTTITDIVEGLIKQESIKDFFSRVSQLIMRPSAGE